MAQVYDNKLSTAVVAEFQILAPCSRTEETAIEHWRLSKARLSRMHDVMSSYVDEEPGFVTLVSRRGGVNIDTIAKMVAILMTQRLVFPQPSVSKLNFWTLAY
ncbi:hypothetical protein [Chroococcidiopsis sp. TS-821]|uniref:hypothetical protein n=1 Tax=Chroococcidiopsis sp. TS-821 TaxID=1378066 RepID=UPI0011AFD300|nr:hypothetical protein [Chroococcidiopsis sp. TS-821]